MNRRTPPITLVLASSGTVVALMQTITVPMLPILPEITGSAPADVSWMVTATLLSGSVATPLLGRAGDMYGRRRVLLWALAVVVVGSLLCALSSALPILVLGRALQGVGLAATPLGISILRAELPPERVAGAVAMMSATIGIGAAIGLPIAAFVIEYVSWHAMFWVCAVAALAVLLTVRWAVPETEPAEAQRFDYLGAAGLATVLVCLMLAITKGPDWGFTAPPTLMLGGAAVLIALGWGWYELRRPEPLLDLRVAARPAVLLANLVALFVGFAFYANSLSTAQLVQEPESTGYGLGLSIVASGLCLLPGGLAMAFLAPVSARLTNRRGAKTTVALASIVIALGYVVRYLASHALWSIILGATVVAVGTALAYSALPVLIMGAIPVSETGEATGVNTLMRMVGQAGSSAMSAAVLSHLVIGGAPSLDAYLLIFLVAGAAAVCALVLALMVPRQPLALRVPGPAPAPEPV
ncbi:MFS transporter [Actinocorallia sp. A-T 12471]|uniref:MFS transporter n=1 Tax=Actinocorallia sp. A-T 12471 TaxID=3089813 RepID=UPI0029CDDF81|nr:MFS transporter [Actinocorallia sp. A-T 12471]MDX6739983.1 MFS transporter [Actinocorallia sp. A-T 12471]